MIEPDKTYVIRNKETLELWVAESGKRSWKKKAHAKCAFAYSGSWQAKDSLLYPYLRETMRQYGSNVYYTSVKFDDQSVYEIVEVKPDTDKKVLAAAALLEEVIDTHNISAVLYGKIRKFLEEL